MQKARLRPSVSSAYALGALVAAGLLGYAFYVQYVEGILPCKLCHLQRLMFFLMGLGFTTAALHRRCSKRATAFYTGWLLFCGAVGAAIALRQLWIQHLPPGSAPQCGAGIDFLFRTLPFDEALRLVLEGSVDCAVSRWHFLGMTMAAWALLCFIALSAGAWWMSRKAQCRQ